MYLKDAIDIIRLPRTFINLMLERTEDNDPFFARLTESFFERATARHPKFPLAGRYEYGFALCALPSEFEMYFKRLEPSAHRNYRKALRLGYAVKRLDFNTHLEDVSEILKSTPVRQGELPPEIREGRVRPIADPPSRSPFHDYPYFGVFKDGRLSAYASCLVAGELCNLNDLYGHAGRQNDGVVPLLIIEIARELMASYKAVKYFAYDTYYGASDTMRRFKRKFLFNPYHVKWVLGSPRGAAADRSEKMFIFRMDVNEPLPPGEWPEGAFVMAAGFRDVLRLFPSWAENFGWAEAVKNAAKVMSGRKIFFGVKRGKTIAQSGWANLGFCRHYPVEKDATVLGTVWTDPGFRGQGLAPAALRRIISVLNERGCRRFYVDVGESNQPSQRMIQKSGFFHRIA